MIDTFVPENYGHRRCREMLGSDFISPEEIMRSFGSVYRREQLNQFEDTAPSDAVLQWCLDRKFVVVAGPPRTMSVMWIRKFKRRLFAPQQGGWFQHKSVRFAYDDKVTPSWLILCSESVPHTRNQTWHDQLTHLSSAEYVPSAPELIWGMVVFREIRNMNFALSPCVRTSSQDQYGNHVIVGHEYEQRICMDVWSDTTGFPELGLASARKLD